MLKKAPFWIAFTIASIALGAFAAANFSKAFPLVHLDIDMDRDRALAEARRLAEERGWGPEGFRQAASFGVEAEVQSYVELEGGGKDAFAEMIRGDLHSPYRWRVRHFQPGETTETTIRFTPAGRPLGFRETLPEDAPGASLDEASARALAQEEAATRWDVELEDFELVEASQEVRPGGRIDHAFVYERSGVRIGEEGRYRLRLGVGGDRFTELTRFVKVPEAFDRRFEEMRSANNVIALVSGMVMLVVFVGGGCGVGLFFLFRRRWVIWKTPLAWGVFVALLQLLAGINQWPMAWMGYDTAVSTTNFTLLYLGGQLAAFVGFALFFSLVFMGAESLTRRAFPDHLRFWKVWSPRQASSPQVLGSTVAGYLLIAFFFAYEVVLYFVSHRVLGWWSPADPLYDPDFLATWLPWLPAIALSLQAGFWEECLFRAVPLAGAVLIGRKLGHVRLWVGAALVFQAVVFAAGHANYPTQPAYARVVELIPPAIGFGLVYLRFGLLPVIVLHFAYDVVWFSLPILVSGAALQQGVVVLVTLVPLLVVAWARFQTGRFEDVGEEGYNRSWTPPASRVERAAPPPLPERAELAPRLRLAWLAAGAVGLVLWWTSQPFSSVAPRIEIGREAAVAAARGELAERGVELGDSWKTMSTVQASTGLPHRFVWQKSDEAAFRRLLGRYLADPRWWVRFATFEGEVDERAEEYHVWVSGQGEVTRFLHRLPEARPGADLAEDEARTLAHRALEKRYGVDAATLDEVSATPAKQPARRDWTFTFKDVESPVPGDGEARLGVEIAGDEVAHVFRFLHLPEEWERQERNRSSLMTAVQVMSAGLVILAVVAAMGFAILRWTRRQFALRAFLGFTALVFVLGMVSFVNGWPRAEVNFSTAQPYLVQLLGQAVAGPVGVGILALGLGLTIGLLHGIGGWSAPAPPRPALVSGLALGVAAAGLAAFADRFGPAMDPPWADFSEAGSWWPGLGTALGPVTGLITVAALFLLIFATADLWTRRWSERRGHAVGLFLAAGLVLAGTSGDAGTLPLWLAAGAAQGALLLGAYVVVVRHDLTIVPVAVAAATILGLLRAAGQQAYPAALVGHAIGIVLVALLAVYWFRSLRSQAV